MYRFINIFVTDLVMAVKYGKTCNSKCSTEKKVAHNNTLLLTSITHTMGCNKPE
jgi:hypothetical protein